jgi:hypothetical protein
METVTGYVSDLRNLLEESPFPERRSFIKSFVKDVEVTGNQVLLTYTIPMQPHKIKGESIDVPLIGHYGGPNITFAKPIETFFELSIGSAPPSFGGQNYEPK